MAKQLVSEEGESSFSAAAATVPQMIFLQAQERPQAIAITSVIEGVADSLTFAGLVAEATIAAEALGPVEAERVILLCDDPLKFTIAFLAIGFAGGVPVPLAPEAVSNGGGRLKAVVADCEARTVVVSDEVAGNPDSVEDLRVVPFRRPGFAERRREDSDTRRPASDVAFLQYTSGSTGTPKGVVVSHENVLANVRLIESAFAFTHDTVMGSWLPAHHDMGLIGGILAPLCLGRPTVLMPSREFVRRPIEWLKMVDRFGVSVSGGPNFAYELCVSRVSAREAGELDLSRWTVAFNGAEVVRADTLRKFERRFRPAGFLGDKWLPCYGLAEATLLVAGSINDEPRRQSWRVDSSYGTPVVGCRVLAGVQVAVVDVEREQRQPDGLGGEIWIQGPSVARRYWSDPKLSAETFEARLGDEDGTWLRTGDLGYERDGVLYVRGRSKDVIVVRGRNHHAEDVEATVRSVTGGGRCAVFTVDDGRAESAVAVFESKDATAADIFEDRIRSAVALEHGIALNAVVRAEPRTIPVTTSGKVRRHACAQKFLPDRWPSPPAGPAKSGESADLVNERLLRDLASEAMQLEVVSQRSLVAQGLDSVSAVRLQALIEDRVGQRPSISHLLVDLDLASIAVNVGLGLKIRSTGQAGGDLGPAALTSGQEAIWLQDQLAAPGNCNLGRTLRLRGSVDPALIFRAVMDVVGRHGALRSRFVSERGGDRILQTESEALTMTFEDFCVSESDGVTLAASIQQMVTAPFDLSSGLPFRAALYSRPDQTFLLVLVAHHLVMDAWSFAIFLEDMRRAVVDGGRAGTKRPPTSFAAIAHRAVATPLSEGREKGEEALVLPGQLRPRLPDRTFAGAYARSDLDAATVRKLHACAQHLAVTLPSLLFSIFARSLAAVADVDSVGLGWISDGRALPEEEEVVGYCVELRTVAVDLSGDFSVDVSRASRSLLQERAAAASWSRDHVPAVFAYQQATFVGHLGLSALLMNRAGRLGSWGAIEVETVETPHAAAYFPIALYAAEHPQGLFVSWERCVDDLPDATLRDVMAAFSADIQRATEYPRQAPDRKGSND